MGLISRWLIAAALLSGCGEVIKEVCGDGNAAGTEECDEGTANGTSASCCSSTCTFVAASVTCRAGAGVCDAEETCTGASGACPADMSAPDGTPCTGGNGANACSLADICMAGTCSNNDKPTNSSCGTDACQLDHCSATGACVVAGTLTVAIIESQSNASYENMDTKWKAVVDGLGHTSTIYPQTQLNDPANFAAVDVLIVSSGTIALSATAIDTIAAFLASGKGVYVQGEYLQTYAGNVAFKNITDRYTVGFTWGPDLQGQLTASATGCYGTTPTVVSATFPQYYGESGSATGTGVHTVQTNTGTNQPIAFDYCRQGGGLIVVKTDEDDIINPNAGTTELMKNIFYRLANAGACVQ